MWLNWVGQNRETDEEHADYCVEEGFQLARVKSDGDDAGRQGSSRFGESSINIWDGPELGLTWFKKSSSYFQNNISIFLLSSISNTPIFKVRGVLHWVNFLVMKTMSNIFRGTFCWRRWYLNIFYIPFIFFYYQQVLFTLRVSLLLSLLNDASVDIGDNEDSFQFSPEAEFITLKYNYRATATVLKLCWNS